MTNQSMCKGGKKKSKKRYDGRWCDDHHLRWMRAIAPNNNNNNIYYVN
jgi:hypothetical protein